MDERRVLVANRGEIALRILRGAAGRRWSTVAVASADDATAAHARGSDGTVVDQREGPAVYLDIDRLVTIARERDCSAVHTGYGFLSESPAFARAVEAAGLTFIGPRPDTLDALGSKLMAKQLARSLDIPVAAGPTDPADLASASAVLARSEVDAVMIKAVAGGGGRGLRMVERPEDLEEAMERCRSEALKAFGDDTLLIEEVIGHARHVEVQVVGDGSGACAILGDRDCSLQRRNQKIIEIGPAPGLSADLRTRLHRSARELAEAVTLRSLGTFEFLVGADGRFVFCEANPRIQVEHTVTEESTGIDLVDLQFALAEGAELDDLGLDPDRVPTPVASALQLRINAETMAADGAPLPAGGTARSLRWPLGPGIRIDTDLEPGRPTSSRYDPLVAKVIVSHPLAGRVAGDLEAHQAALIRARRALDEMVLDGVVTNQGFLQALLERDEVATATATVSYVDDHSADLSAAAEAFDAGRSPSTPLGAGSPGVGDGDGVGGVGASVDSTDPLAVLDHGKAHAGRDPVESSDDPADLVAPLQGTVVSISVAVGDQVGVGDEVLVLEAMKMEHVVVAPYSGTVAALRVPVGQTVSSGRVLVRIDPGDEPDLRTSAAEEIDLDHIRPDLTEAIERHALGLDAARPSAVERRRRTGQRTTRENIADLCDPDSFVEYGALVVAAQRRRRSMEDLRENTPADGLVAGVGSINGELFDAETAQCVVLSYDYTVLAGTQGLQNHRKKDRMFELAAKASMPVVLFTEGGGGRPGDTDGLGVAGLDCLAFQYFAELNGHVPLVGINSGRCFAGNAALLGCCDVIIATANSNIGMGGPAMIEGGGLGVFTPEEVGPMTDQVPNGVVDVAVANEAEAVAVAKRYLSYFQGSLGQWETADQRLLRHVIPENRLRSYDVRSVIETLADTDSVLELRAGFGVGMITALARIEGRPVGIVANNPVHLGGAIDSDNADKAARFMQLCDAFGLPLVFLCDTPGIMVGPEVEKTALVRHAARMFVTAAGLGVPFCTIVLRKGYGLGAQAMAGGSFHAPSFTVAWPTGEFGGMGLEGAVKLGYRKELAAIDDPEERRATFEEMVDRMYQVGKGVNMASHFEIDDVIDPADSRRWIATMLATASGHGRTVDDGRRRTRIDTW